MRNTFILFFSLLFSQTLLCQVPESLVIEESMIEANKRKVVKAIKSIRFAPGIQISGTQFRAYIVPQEQPEAIEVSLQKEPEFFEIEIFPNPAVSKAQVELGNSFQIDEATLYSITGALVKKYTLGVQNSDKTRYSFDVSDVPEGLYILTLSDRGTALASEKLLIEN